ncbi:MAG: Gfo/Idh/MocA family protein [bacterium]
MTKINWGIIGCGQVTEVKSGPALQKTADSSLVAVMRRDGDKARDYAQRHGVPRWYDNAEELIHDTEVNAVYVATPPASHAEYAIKSLGAGKPVYVEKPMARNYDECTQMLQASREAAIPIFVAYYRRCLPTFLKVKECLDSGVIGEARLVNVRLHYPPRPEDFDSENRPWRVQPELAGGGYFVDLGSHQFDILDYLFGPIVSAEGLAVNQAGLYPAEDAVSANFIFESGVLGSGSWCFTASEFSQQDRLEIVGNKGQIVCSTFAKNPIVLTTAAGTKEFQMPTPQHIQQPLIQTVVDELLGKGNCPSKGVTAARTNRVLDEILKDWRSQYLK